MLFIFTTCFLLAIHAPTAIGLVIVLASYILINLRDNFKHSLRITPALSPLYNGDKLGYGMKVDGPAIIEDPLTTTVVIPSSKVTVNKVGSYIMELS